MHDMIISLMEHPFCFPFFVIFLLNDTIKNDATSLCTRQDIVIITCPVLAFQSNGSAVKSACSPVG